MVKAGISETIEHERIVQDVDGNSVLVKIIASSACSGCHAESACGLSGKKEKIIRIKNRYEVSPGDNVTVSMKQSQGFRAVMLGYIIPFIAMTICLVILLSLSFSEMIAAIVSLAILVPYYIILYLFRKRIDESFTFILKT